MRALITIICLCIPFSRIRRPVRQWLKIKLQPYSNAYSRFLLRRYASRGDVVLWFDHAMGGGTETYSLNQIRELKRKKKKVLRIQYFPAYKYFLMSTHTMSGRIRFFARDIDTINNAIDGLNIREIVVNNLVGYDSSVAALDFVTRLKRDIKPKPFVSFRGHDFQAICPSYNLINCDGMFCDLTHNSGCENCWKRKRLAVKPIDEQILRSGATTISAWRDAWGKFFTETLDEIIVFSDYARNLFVRAYPQLESKIIVIPHSIKQLRRVSTTPHDTINIACLGMLSTIKGRDVVFEMCKHIHPDDNVNIVIIGKILDCDDNALPHNLTVTGQYKPQDLPSLMEKHLIDLVFISSVCPETFSYTASEAMSMGMPVACYNMGAPAERVGKYKDGLVLTQINPQQNLQEIITFIKQKRKDA